MQSAVTTVRAGATKGRLARRRRGQLVRQRRRPHLAESLEQRLVLSAGPAAQLAFTHPPVTGIASVGVNAYNYGAVSVAVEDSSGNVVTTDASAVTLTLSHGVFSTGKSSATIAAVNGVAQSPPAVQAAPSTRR
jgi:hypothetical protein